MGIAQLMQRVLYEAKEERRKALEEANIYSPEWKFVKGFNLIHNPSIRCPGCMRYFVTNQVWMVDESNQRLSKVWDLKGTPISIYRVHPHVDNDGGEICTGQFKSALDALLYGLNPDSYYSSVATYLRKLGDDCRMSQRELCGSCEHFVDIDDMYQDPYGGWECNECRGYEEDYVEEEDE